MILERPLRFLRPFYHGALWRKKADEKVIYLTFDDGPVPQITQKVLEILNSFGVKATFFCVGGNVEKYPDEYNKILESGHRVGNHTHNHIKGLNHTKDAYLKNVQKAAKLIKSDLFRPPYGQITPGQLRLLKKTHTVVLWDLITRDYNAKLSPDYILGKIKKMSRNGSIVVFHDSVKAEKNLFAVLPQAIEFWQKEGYQFATL